MALPAARPLIYDAETRPGVASLATLYRKLVHWARWTYHRDLYTLPADPRAELGGSVDFAVGDGSIGSFYVPAPTTAGTQVVVFHVRALLASSSDTIELVLASSSGQQKKHLITCAGQGSALEGWSSFEWNVTPGTVVSGVMVCSSQTNQLISLCGWWKPLATGGGITIESSTLAFPSRTWAAQDRPQSVHFVSRLARLANRYAAAHPRPVVAKCYRNLSGTGSVTKQVGIYRVMLGDRVSAIRVTIGHSLATDATAEVYVEGVLAGSYALTGTAEQETVFDTEKTISADLAVTAGAARMVEIAVQVVAAAAAPVRIDSITIEERPPTSGNLGLATGDTVPGAFPSLSEANARGSGPIRAADWAALLDAIVWLWAKRYRILVSDFRHAIAVNDSLSYPEVGKLDHNMVVSFQADEVVTVRGRLAARSTQADASKIPFQSWDIRRNGATSSYERVPSEDYPTVNGDGFWVSEETPLLATGRATIRYAVLAGRILGTCAESFIPET